MASLSDIKWSSKTYTLKNFARMFELPQLVKITGGYYDRSENDTFSNGQVIRLHCLKSQERIMATDQRRHNLSIPLNFNSARFDVYNQLTKTLETRYLRDVVDTYALPQVIEFSQKGELNFMEYVDNTVKVDESFGKLKMTDIYEEEFFQGNSVNDGIDNDTVNSEILQLPLYLKITVAVAEGFKHGNVDKWETYGRMLSKIVATEVDHSKENESDEIRLFPTYELGRIRSHDYGHAYPTGMMSVQNSRREARKHQLGQVHRKISKEVPVPRISNGFPPNQPPSPKSVTSQDRLTQTSTQLIYYLGDNNDFPKQAKGPGESPKSATSQERLTQTSTQLIYYLGDNDNSTKQDKDKNRKKMKPGVIHTDPNPLPNGQKFDQYPEQNLFVSVHPLDYQLLKNSKRSIEGHHSLQKTYHVPVSSVFDEYGFPMPVRRLTVPVVSRETSFKEVQPNRKPSRGPSIKELKEISRSSPLVVIPLPDYDV